MYYCTFRADQCTLNEYPGHVFYLEFVCSNPLPLLGGIQLVKTISKLTLFKQTSIGPDSHEIEEQGQSANNDIEENSEFEIPPNIIVVAENND